MGSCTRFFFYSSPAPFVCCSFCLLRAGSDNFMCRCSHPGHLLHIYLSFHLIVCLSVYIGTHFNCISFLSFALAWIFPSRLSFVFDKCHPSSLRKSVWFISFKPQRFLMYVNHIIDVISCLRLRRPVFFLSPSSLFSIVSFNFIMVVELLLCYYLSFLFFFSALFMFCRFFLPPFACRQSVVVGETGFWWWKVEKCLHWVRDKL